MTLPSISFSGLATPFDTNQVIDQILAVERIPLQQLQARQATYEAKDTAWVGITTRLSALRTALDELDGGLGSFLSASSSDPEAVAATVTGSPSPGSMSFTVDRLAASHRVISDATFASADDLVGAGEFTVEFTGGATHTVTTDASTTYADLAAELDALDGGFSATVLATHTGQYQLMISADEPGDASVFTASSTIAGFESFTAIQTGGDAQISIGTLTVERSSNTVTDLIEGVTLQLTATTASDVGVTVSRDVSAAADAVEALVEELNATLGNISTATRYDADAESAGALIGDSTARGIVSALRNAVSGAVGGTDGNLIPSAVGISITRTGTFTFDRDAFEAALAEDFASVNALFTGEVAVRLDEALDATEGVDGSVSRARDRWQASIDDLDDRIFAWENRLERREAALIKQFAALDSALSALTAQSNWLASQLASFSQQQQ